MSTRNKGLGATTLGRGPIGAAAMNLSPLQMTWFAWSSGFNICTRMFPELENRCRHTFARLVHAG